MWYSIRKLTKKGVIVESKHPKGTLMWHGRYAVEFEEGVHAPTSLSVDSGWVIMFPTGTLVIHDDAGPTEVMPRDNVKEINIGDDAYFWVKESPDSEDDDADAA
jgi:hypothetical protein